MTRIRMVAGLLGGCLLLWAGAALAATPAQILHYRPKQEGVVISTPTAQEEETCRVSWTANPRGGGVWLLVDPQGRPLRRLVDRSEERRVGKEGGAWGGWGLSREEIR